MDAVNTPPRRGRGHRHRTPASITDASVRLCAIVVLAACTACATRPPPGIAGRWQPVNRFDDAPVAIPLVRPYVFQASPVDASLRALLARWAADARMTLDYAHPSDFSLYRPVADVHSTSLAEAAAALSVLYARQHLVVSVDGETLRVRATDVAPAHGSETRTGAPPATTGMQP